MRQRDRQGAEKRPGNTVEPQRAINGAALTPHDDASPGAVHRDLERRVAELEESNAALQAEAGQTRLILESAVDYAIYTLDKDGLVTSWNVGAQRVLGYEDFEVLGQSGDFVFTPEDRASDAFADELRRAAKHGRAENERWHLRKDGVRFWASGLSMPIYNGGRRPKGFLVILRDRTIVRLEQQRRTLLLAELNHRVKNTLASVQSVAAQTARQTDTPDAFRVAFQARLMALARSHDMLTESNWEGASLREALNRTLSAYSGETGSRFSLFGSSVRLAPAAVVTLNLAFHELATNAAKHGALLVPCGRIQVRWAVEKDEGGSSALVISWRESGGPPVRPPLRRGFGSRLIERGLPQEFGAKVTLDFAPAGVECHIRLPATKNVLIP